MAGIPTNISAYVGKTPVVQLTRLSPADSEASLFAKVEAFNPGGSVKDRIGLAMIEAAEREGQIEPGRTTIVEATSGNTGIALAFVCAAKGYDLVLTLPQGMSRERERLLALYGARFEITESLGGMHEAVEAAQRMATGDDVFLPDQFSNPANPEAHRRTTGPELWEALDGDIDVFVAGVGTGGTITGVGEYLKARNPKLHVVAIEPASSPVLSGGRAGSSSHPGHRRGLRAEGPEPRDHRRDPADHRRRRRSHRATACCARGLARGDFRRCRRGRRAAAGRPCRVRPCPDRGDPPGLRRALRLAALVRPRNSAR